MTKAVLLLATKVIAVEFVKPEGVVMVKVLTPAAEEAMEAEATPAPVILEG